MDLRDLGAEAWVLWQPDWNVIAFDPKGGAPHLKKQFYVLAQYTRFIRPGFPDHLRWRSLQHARCVFPGVKAAGAGQHQLGYADRE